MCLVLSLAKKNNSKSVMAVLYNSHRGGCSASQLLVEYRMTGTKQAPLFLGICSLIGTAETQMVFRGQSYNQVRGSSMRQRVVDSLGILKEVEFWLLKHIQELDRWAGSSQCCLKPILGKREPQRNLFPQKPHVQSEMKPISLSAWE